jgi:cell wall-associated NlpC family hydrolase
VEAQIPDRAQRLSPAALVAALAAAAIAVGCGQDQDAADGDRPEPTLTTASKPKERAGRPDDPRSRPQVVQLEGAGSAPAGDPTDDAPSPGAPSDAEVRAELRQARKALASFKQHLTSTAFLQTGPRARVLPDGTAVAPANAPDVVKKVILAGNEIAKFPYKWGGGHGAWRDTGYDCSGSVSFALAAAGMVKSPLTSGLFLEWGVAGPGEWITIYTNPGHMFMVVAGLRFDTSGQGRAGTRWQEAPADTDGMVARHYPGV